MDHINNQQSTINNQESGPGRKQKRLKRLLRIIAALLFAGLLAAGIVGWYLLMPNTAGNATTQPYYLYLRKGTTSADIAETLSKDHILKNLHTFTTVARFTQSDPLLKPGRYRIDPGLSNYRLLQKLRNGLQEPVRFTFNNISLVGDFCSVAGKAFHFDSLRMMETMQDEAFLDSLGIRPAMLLGHLLPNTYEVYWTITPEGLIARLVKESENFWSGRREDILAERGLDKEQVLILASIIQKETNHTSEMARMAGVYINRLDIGMKLQADPTVKYAIGDPGIRRLLNSHLDYPSPYNTYYVEGLPAGVICAPNPSTIDQVLNYEEHDYLYFCAKPGYNSTHAFAVTYPQHLQNREKYKVWLNSEGIR